MCIVIILELVIMQIFIHQVCSVARNSAFLRSSQVVLLPWSKGHLWSCRDSYYPSFLGFSNFKIEIIIELNHLGSQVIRLVCMKSSLYSDYYVVSTVNITEKLINIDHFMFLNGKTIVKMVFFSKKLQKFEIVLTESFITSGTPLANV